MVNEFKIITLCGSTRFKDAFLEAQKRLTLEGNIVISIGLFELSGDEEVWEPSIKNMLERIHLSKIDMADEVYVINVDGYIGESTKREIEYAKAHGKAISYLVFPKNESDFISSEDFNEDYCPSIEDYIKSLQSSSDNLNRLKRFRPYYHPDGSMDFCFDKNRIVFRMIDSIQDNYEIGLECPLNKDYYNDFKSKTYETNNSRKIYEHELLITKNDSSKSIRVSVCALRDFPKEIKENSQTTFPKQYDYDEFTLSDDKKTLLSWNYGKGSIYQAPYTVVIPEGIEIIADGAFAGHENLDRIYMPKTLKKIGHWAFANCGKIRIIFNNEQLEEIGEFAFYGCNLLPIRGHDCLPSRITKLNMHSLNGCTIVHQLVSAKKIGGVWHPQVDTASQEIIDDENDSKLYNDLIVNSIEDEFGVVYDSHQRYILYCNNKKLSKYTIKDTTIGIFKNSFYNMDCLKEIDLKNAKYIGEGAFYGCLRLNSIYGCDNIQRIGAEAFSKTGIIKFTLPSTLNKLGSCAFQFCNHLEEVTIKGKLIELAPYVFSGCSSLKNVYIHDELLIIGRMAFSGCKSLATLSLPNKIRKLDELCFYKSGIKKIVLPSTLLLMGNSPFCGCKDVEILSNSSFFYANEQCLLGNNKRILISYLKDEANIVIPRTVEIIQGSSFGNIISHRVFLPNSVVYIDKWAFRNLHADIVNIPDSVVLIIDMFDKDASIKMLYISKKLSNIINLSPRYKINEY